MINENNISKDVPKKKFIKKLFAGTTTGNNLNRSSMSIYSHGSNK